MNEDLDDMLYAAYLAKLESLKGTKKPLVDFIKEMANDTYDFYKLTYRQFKLVTIAVNNCTAIKVISSDLLHNLQRRLTTLIRDYATEENILDLLEFYKTDLRLEPTSIEQLIVMDKLYNIIRINRPELEISFYTGNVPLFNRFPYLVYTTVHKYNPDSLLLKRTSRSTSQAELAKAKKYSTELVELLNHYEEYLINKELV